MMLGLMLTFALGVAGVPQTPVGNVDWAQLAGSSKVVVVGTVEEVSLVINPDKQRSRTTSGPAGSVLVELQNPADYILGRTVRIRIEEVIKHDGTLKAGGTVNVFLPGMSVSDGQAALVKKETYLLFLAALKPSKELSKALIQPEDQPSKRIPFAMRPSYRIAGDSNGAIRVSTDTQATIEAAKQATRSVAH